MWNENEKKVEIFTYNVDSAPSYHCGILLFSELLLLSITVTITITISACLRLCATVNSNALNSKLDRSTK